MNLEKPSTQPAELPLCSGAARRSRQAGARCLHNWVDQYDGTRICWRCGALWPLPGCERPKSEIATRKRRKIIK